MIFIIEDHSFSIEYILKTLIQDNYIWQHRIRKHYLLKKIWKNIEIIVDNLYKIV